MATGTEMRTVINSKLGNTNTILKIRFLAKLFYVLVYLLSAVFLKTLKIKMEQTDCYLIH